MKLKCQFAITEIDGDMMAVPVGGDAKVPRGVLRLNKTSYTVFEMLQKETDEQEIIDAYLQKYGHCSAEARSDVLTCLRELKETGLVE